MRPVIFLFPLLFCVELVAAPRLDYQVVERVAQDPTYFTQGFEFRNGWFYHSSGLYGLSFLSRYQHDSNKAQKLPVPSNIFAEGLTVLNKKLFLLSWKAQTAWQFDRDTLQLQKTFQYAGEGWGLANNSSQLFLSNGSDTIYFIDPNTFQRSGSIKVSLNDQAVSNLNELEFANGFLWANQWKSTLLYQIQPESGQVLATVDLGALQQEAAVDAIDSVANGIAYDEAQDLFWVTGKYWKYRYLIKINSTSGE